MTSSTKTKRERSRGERWLDREGERYETRRGLVASAVGDGGRGGSAPRPVMIAASPTSTEEA